MKTTLYILAGGLFLFSCSGEQSDDMNHSTDHESDQTTTLTETLDTVNVNKDIDTASTNGVQEGSTKALLIGEWQDANDEDITVKITPDRYISYAQGKEAWDREWDLSGSADYYEDSISDNGIFILVYAETLGDVFYAREITDISDESFTATVIKGEGGEGETITFKKMDTNLM